MTTHSETLCDSVADLVGRTPLVRMPALEREFGGRVELHAKLEFMNPGGSVKDRPGLQMLRDALADGRLRAGKRIIDATSGNTGVAYSLFGAALGYPVTLVMPANVSPARKAITEAYGTEIVYSSEMEGSDGAIRLVRKLVAEDPERWFYPDQYSNPSNPLAHYLTTGPELLEALGDKLTHFVAGIGTSGTIMGTARRLKEHRRAIHVCAVEPEDALHGLEGLKHMASSLVPAIYHPAELDQVMPMPTEEGWDVAERFHAEEGIFIGHSGGAAIAGALRLARGLPAGQRACMVALIPDRGERYLPLLGLEKRDVW